MKYNLLIIFLVSLNFTCFAVKISIKETQPFLSQEIEKRWQQHIVQTIKKSETIINEENDAFKIYKSLHEMNKALQTPTHSNILSLTEYKNLTTLSRCLFFDIEKNEEYVKALTNATKENSEKAWLMYKRITGHLIVVRLAKHVKFISPRNKSKEQFWKEFLENNAKLKKPEDAHYIKVAFLLIYKIDDIIEKHKKKH
ncbi:unnamed protein product, partial [marine sediment metagenome]